MRKPLRQAVKMRARQFVWSGHVYVIMTRKGTISAGEYQTASGKMYAIFDPRNRVETFGSASALVDALCERVSYLSLHCAHKKIAALAALDNPIRA